jgi:hypothetical protein
MVMVAPATVCEIRPRSLARTCAAAGSAAMAAKASNAAPVAEEWCP